jgi:nucleoside-diphosphate-sugar epimerase
MLKLGVVGANGQVGAELCLLLATRPDIELIAICRNRSGSAFLRWQGISCRHGRVADPTDAPRLLGDCDVVVNSALASGAPAQIRRSEDRIIQSIFAYSKNSATIVHFSTQTVYGDPRPNRWIRWRNPYGRAKLASERRVRLEGRRTKKPTFILRLGHVCGELQKISILIREDIRARNVILPVENRSSNTVYTAAIIGAIEQIIRGAAVPGTYDLMNTPRWTWREVYEYEAGICKLPLGAEILESPRASWNAGVTEPALRLAGSLVAAPQVRDIFAKLFAYLPDSANARLMARWYTKRAQTEIASLSGAREPAEHLSWVENGVRFFPAEIATLDLMRTISLQQWEPRRTQWAADLPDANEAADRWRVPPFSRITLDRSK